MEDSQHLGLVLEVLGHRQARPHLVLQPHAQRPRPAQREPAVVGGGHLAQLQHGLPHQLPVLVGHGGDAPEQRVGVPDDVFGQRCVCGLDVCD